MLETNFQDPTKQRNLGSTWPILGYLVALCVGFATAVWPEAERQKWATPRALTSSQADASDEEREGEWGGGGVRRLFLT